MKLNEFVFKIKKYPLFFCLVAIFLIYFLFFTYTHPLRTQYNKNARTSLPAISQPIGTFSLITEPEDGTASVLEMIKNSKSSIDLVMYEFKDKEIADALISAEQRGVIVRVLINQGYFGKEETMNEPAFAYLGSGGVSVKWTPASFALTHQKTLIVDKKQAVIMTFNFAPKYYQTGRDFGIIDNDQNDVQAIENTFNADWNGQQISTNNADDLVWSPGADSDMLLITNSAQKELDIYNEEMADTRIIDALENATKRGVTVNIIMTYQSAFKNSFSELKNSGAHLNLFHGEKGLYIHAKLIIADQKEAFLGSENFSYGSLDENRELGIFLSDPTIITSLMKTFNNDWQNATPF